MKYVEWSNTLYSVISERGQVGNSGPLIEVDNHGMGLEGGIVCSLLCTPDVCNHSCYILFILVGSTLYDATGVCAPYIWV